LKIKLKKIQSDIYIFPYFRINLNYNHIWLINRSEYILVYCCERDKGCVRKLRITLLAKCLKFGLN